MRLKDIDFNKIQTSLMYAYSESDRIRKEIGLGGLSATQVQFFESIEKILDKYGFKIHYTDLLRNFKCNGKKLGHLPSLTFYKEQYQKELGGDIYIYDKYSVKKKRELLLHEFIHIKDNLTPTWSTNNLNKSNAFMLSPQIVKRVELFTELTAMAFMMPINGLQRDLFSCSYNIKKIVADYKAIETSTVIMWIILHDYFHAHYAMLYRTKDNIEKERLFIIDEYCDAVSRLDIYNTIHTTGSIANKSWCTRFSQDGESTIDTKDYQCFCFYEEDVRQPLPSEVSSVEMIVKCDKMVIIGWSKHIYNYIQQLELKQNSTSARNP